MTLLIRINNRCSGNFQKWSDHGVLCISWFENTLRATVICHFSTPQLPKVLRTWCVLYFLIWKYASHHSDLPFFHAPTSKSALTIMVCFVFLDLNICFAPQWPAIFPRPNLQKCSDHGVLCISWFENMLRTTVTCHFSTPQLPKVLQAWCALYFLIWKYASLLSDLPFFHAPTSKSAPSMVCFVFLDLKIRFAPHWPAIFPRPNFQKCSESIWKYASHHSDLPFFHAPTSKSAPTMVCFVFFDLKIRFAPQWPAIFPHPNFQKCSEHGVLCISWFENMLLSTVTCHFSTPQLPKVLRTWCVLYFLIWKYASHHSDLPFFHAPTSKSALTMVCFVFLVLKIRFAPRWPAIFPRPNFQKCSDHGVLCISWFENTLRTTVTCHFSTPQLPKVVRSWCALYFLIWKYASRHSDLPFFHTLTSKSAPNMVFFSLIWKYASHHSDLPFFHAPTSKSGPIMVCFVFLDLKIRFAPQWSAIFPHPNFQKCSEHGVFCISWFENTLRTTVTCHFSTPQLPKVLWPSWCALYFLIWTYASLHSDLPFFHAPTSKSAPTMVCFVFLDLKICFAPQWPAIFPRPNFQKCSDHGVLCISWFENMLRTTVTCHFSTPQLPKVVRSWCALYFLIWKYASHHSDLPFFHAPTSKSGRIMVCFVFLDLKIRFAPQWPTIFPHPNFQKCSEHGVFCISWFENTLRTTVTCHFSTPQLPKVLWPSWCALYFLIWTYASLHSDLPFFHAPTSKSAPTMVCFVFLDLKICFAPQWPAIFPRPNFQKCSDHGVLCISWFENMLRTTVTYHFSTPQLPKVLRPWCALYFLIWKYASHHSDLPFFHAPTSKSAPSMVCFVFLDLKICFAPQWPAIFPCPNFQKCSDHGVLCISWFENTLRTTVTCHFSTPQPPKVLRPWCALYFLIWKYASHHSDLPFFHAPTSKSAPTMVCFVFLDLKIRFAPQWPAIFPRPNFQKCSDHGVLCISWFENTLRTTVTCHFSTPQLPRVLRAWCVFYILTHRTFQGRSDPGCFARFDLETCFAPQLCAIFHFSSSHRARRFSEPTFRPSQPTNHWKNIARRNFPSTSRTWIFFLVLFSYALLFSAFCFSILSEVWLLNFVWWRCAFLNFHELNIAYSVGVLLYSWVFAAMSWPGNPIMTPGTFPTYPDRGQTNSCGGCRVYLGINRSLN